jgi:hypothetical protein
MFGASRASSQIAEGLIFVVTAAWVCILLSPKIGNCSDSRESLSPMPAGIAVPGAAGVSGTITNVAAGPLEDKRRAVLAQIMSAKNQGCGVGGYLNEFNRIEQMVKSGQPYGVVDERLERLRGNLDEQLKRAEILKTQHPVPTAPPPETSDASVPPEQVKVRTVADVKKAFDGRKTTTDDLAPEAKEKFLKSEQDKELTKKLTGN